MKVDKVQENVTESILAHLLQITEDIKRKIDTMSEEMAHLKAISTKITEIHRLHFPKDALEKQNLTEKFLAELFWTSQESAKENADLKYHVEKQNPLR